MNTRLQQFLNAENLSQSQFADTIGVARASISHIMSGRNKPGFDFILSMAKCFPALNIDWLITGKGKMYKQSEESLKLNSSNDKRYIEESIFDDDSIDLNEPKSLFSEPEIKTVPASNVKRNTNQTLPDYSNIVSGACKQHNKRNISRIVVFFDDNTFQEFH